MCVLIFSTPLVWKIVHYKNWARYDKKFILVFMLFLSDFNGTWIFSRDFREMLIYQNSWKSVEFEPRCSMRTDGRRQRRQTERHDEANIRFSQFCERVSNSVVAYCYHMHALFSWKNRGRVEIFQTASNTAGSRNRSANQVHLALLLLQYV
jgi:hypothetical protein